MAFFFSFALVRGGATAWWFGRRYRVGWVMGTGYGRYRGLLSRGQALCVFRSRRSEWPLLLTIPSPPAVIHICILQQEYLYLLWYSHVVGPPVCNSQRMWDILPEYKTHLTFLAAVASHYSAIPKQGLYEGLLSSPVRLKVSDICHVVSATHRNPPQPITTHYNPLQPTTIHYNPPPVLSGPLIDFDCLFHFSPSHHIVAPVASLTCLVLSYPDLRLGLVTFLMARLELVVNKLHSPLYSVALLVPPPCILVSV